MARRPRCLIAAHRVRRCRGDVPVSGIDASGRNNWLFIRLSADRTQPSNLKEKQPCEE
jgi:hypothetical protein